MSRNRLWLFSIFLLTTNIAFAAPAQVVILRHGEKPAQGINLDRRGYERARKLPDLFLFDPALNRYNLPVAIYPMKQLAANTSNRAVETVQPLSYLLDLPLQNLFTIDQISELVKSVMRNPEYDGKMVVICWEHAIIPEMVKQFGYDKGPATWPDDEYDRLWILHFHGNEVTKFENLPQHLLPGDRRQ